MLIPPNNQQVFNPKLSYSLSSARPFSSVLHDQGICLITSISDPAMIGGDMAALILLLLDIDSLDGEDKNIENIKLQCPEK